MKNVFTNLALFLVFAVAFSSLTACSRTQPDANASNTANATANTTATNTESKSANYPPLPSGIANTEFELLDGTMSKVSDRKGKVLLLDLWGIWCGPCVAEMPALARLQTAYADKGFEIIGLNIGDSNGVPEDPAKIKAFGEKLNINYTLARSRDSLTAQFYLLSRQQAVPQTFLVNREGHLRGVFIGGGQKVMDSIIQTVDKTMSE